MCYSNTRLSGCAALCPASVTWCRVACRVLLKIVYLLACQIFGLAVLVFRGDLAKDAELLVLRHENAVLRRHVAQVRYGLPIWSLRWAGLYRAGARPAVAAMRVEAAAILRNLQAEGGRQPGAGADRPRPITRGRPTPKRAGWRGQTGWRRWWLRPHRGAWACLASACSRGHGRAARALSGGLAPSSSLALGEARPPAQPARWQRCSAISGRRGTDASARWLAGGDGAGGYSAGLRLPACQSSAAPAVPGLHAEAAQLGPLAQAPLEFREAGEGGQGGDVVPEPDGVLRAGEPADHRAEERRAVRRAEMNDRRADVPAGQRQRLVAFGPDLARPIARRQGRPPGRRAGPPWRAAARRRRGCPGWRRVSPAAPGASKISLLTVS